MRLHHLLPILLLCVACGGSPDKPAAGKDTGTETTAAPAEAPADARDGESGGQTADADFEGTWVLVDEQLGSMKLTVTDGDWVLTDLRGKLWEFDDSPETDDGVTKVTTELETPKPGLKLLFNRPHTALEAFGTYNFRKGQAMAEFQRLTRDGQEVMWCRFYREADPEDTLRAVNLIRQPE